MIRAILNKTQWEEEKQNKTEKEKRKKLEWIIASSGLSAYQLYHNLLFKR